MTKALISGQTCHAIYDSIPLEVWIENERLYFRAYIHYPPSIGFTKQFYQSIGIQLEYIEEYIQISSKLHLKSYMNINDYLTQRIDTLYKYLILSFQTEIKHPIVWKN